MTTLIRLLLLIGLGMNAACHTPPAVEQVPVPLPERVTEGMNNLQYSKSLNADSFGKKPPPPPFEEYFGDHNFFEDEQGAVYYYRLIRDSRFCDDESVKTRKLRCQLWGRSTRLQQVRADNLDFILHHGIRSLRFSHRYVSIGIYADSTVNPLIRKLLQRMQRYNTEINWKVRLTCPAENLSAKGSIESLL